jgi:hypothetical protein
MSRSTRHHRQKRTLCATSFAHVLISYPKQATLCPMANDGPVAILFIDSREQNAITTWINSNNSLLIM